MLSLSIRGFGAVALVSLLSACSATGNNANAPSSDGGVLGNVLRGGPSAAPDAEQAAVVQGACPQVSLREGTAYYRQYARGGDDDPSRLIHQASIADTTRQCTLSGNEVVINVAVAGRVVTGPEGGAGSVRMPIRVAAVVGEEVLYSELTDYSTDLAGSTGQFLFTDPNVRIPADQARLARIYVGFDEGPYDTP